MAWVPEMVVVPSAHNFVQGRGRFTIELSEADANEGRVSNYPLTFLLDDDQRERLRELVNAVRRRMPPPDPDILRGLTDGERRWYLAGFAPVGAPFPTAQDVWFEYVDEEDAAAAFRFVAEVLPACLAALTRVGAEEDARRSGAPTGAGRMDDADAIIESIRSSLRLGPYSDRDPQSLPDDG